MGPSTSGRAAWGGLPARPSPARCWRPVRAAAAAPSPTAVAPLARPAPHSAGGEQRRCSSSGSGSGSGSGCESGSGNAAGRAVSRGSLCCGSDAAPARPNPAKDANTADAPWQPLPPAARSPSLGPALAAAAAAMAAATGPCLPAALAADEAIRYNSAAGEGIVKGLSGLLYIGLLGFFLYRTFNRRARQAREERLAGQGPVRTIFTGLIEKAKDKPVPKATPLSCMIGAVQAGAIAAGLFFFTFKVEGAINVQALPDGYTARNIAITVRTIIIGLLYLVTFIFSANTVGLAGLSIQLLLFPELDKDEGPARPAQPEGPQLPKVKVTSSPEDIRRAFESVSPPSPPQSAPQSAPASPPQPRTPNSSADSSRED